MNKKIISDIIVSKKTIRQIPVSVRKMSKKEDEMVHKDISDFDNEEEYTAPKRREPSFNRKPLNPKFVIWLIAGICLLALFFGISILFSSATVIVTPKTQKVTFTNEAYVAKADATGVTDLAFEVLKVTETAGETVAATEEKDVSQKATGKVIIYNNYSTAPQRLINNTRFEANNGMVYRINSSIIVPGLKKVDGKNVPGSIESTVFADQPGDTYNMKVADLAGDFKIPGFKGDVRYDGFNARLKEDMVGGFIGKQRIVADDLRKATEEIIKTKLKEQLLKELYAVKPENYLMFKDGYNIDYKNIPDSAVDKDKAKINIEGTLNGIVFNTNKLANYIAVKKIKDFDGLPVELVPTDNLVSVFSGADSTGLWKNKTLEIKLNGDAVIKWQYDVNAIKKDLLGKKEADLKNLAAKYKSSVNSIKVIFTPVWTRYFPDNINKIRVEEEIL